jgi:AraC family transcriptional regulator
MDQKYLSEPFEVCIPEYRMAKAIRKGENPEDEVVSFLEKWATERGQNVSQSRHFGFDVPVSEGEKEQGLRAYEYWLEVSESVMPEGEVSIADFPGGRYIAVRIEDPFADPFERIGSGWKALVEHIKQNNIPVEWCSPGSCLEEVVSIEGNCYMNVMVKLK